MTTTTTTTTTTMTVVSDDHIQEVSSWIHDEGRCVTTQTIAWTFGLSRTQASEVLKQCCTATAGNYQVTLVEAKQTEEDGVKQTGESL